MRDVDTCFLCGKPVPEAPEPLAASSTRTSEGDPWTRAGVVRAMKTFHFFIGRSPTRADWQYEDGRSQYPPSSAVELVFGSFGAALAAAGFESTVELPPASGQLGRAA